jgi:uncharacterized protein YcgL (UPF0745 family)
MQRTLGIRDKQILYLKAEKKCENCGETLEYHQMQVGHKKAASKGGSATLKNCVCLCYPCNKLQGTDNWITFQRKQGKTIETDKITNRLMNLNMDELKFLAIKHNMKVKGRIDNSGFDPVRKPPSKKQYIKKLMNVVTEEDLNIAIISKEPLSNENKYCVRNRLKDLKLNELKFIANKYCIKVKGKIEEDFFCNIHKPPSKKQYIKKLAKTLSEEQINNVLQEIYTIV